MKKITNFIIDRSSLTEAGSTRAFTVNGEKDAEFTLQVFNSPTGASDLLDFYDFASLSFTAGFVSTNNLNVKMTSNSYSGVIKFPTNASGDTYTILLLTQPDKDTELTFGPGKNSHSTTIVQYANSTLTFTPTTTTSGSYQTFPTSVTSTGSVAIPSNITEPLDWDIKNTASDAKGFGLRLTRQPIDTDWYFTTTDVVNNLLDGTIEGVYSTVDGATSSSTRVVLDEEHTFAAGGPIRVGDYVYGTGVTGGTTVTAVDPDGDNTKELTISAAMSISDGVTLTFVTPTTRLTVDDLTDLVEGMYITAVSGAGNYLNGTPTIVSIDTDSNKLALSSEQAFVDNITLTFEARGSNMIQEVTGANIDFSNWNASTTSATSAALTKTVRGNSDDSTAVQLNGTYGISGGNFVGVTGLGMVNTTANKVVTNRTSSGDATASSAAGEIIMTLAQTGLTIGSTLYFSGSTETVTIANDIIVNSYPSSNRTIYLNLDNFITIGVNTA